MESAIPGPAEVTPVLIVADDETTLLASLIDAAPDLAVAGVVGSSGWAINAARTAGVKVVLVCLGEPAALEVISRLLAELPGVPILVVSAAIDEFRQTAEAAGAAYLERPFNRDQLLSGLRLTKAASAVAVAQVDSRAGESAIVPGHPATLTVVLGAKGGVGKTTTAIALANSFDVLASGRVALVDLDLQFGDVATMLGLSPLRSISDICDLVADQGEIAATAVETMMAEYHGIGVVCAPSTPDQAIRITGAQVSALLAAIRPHFDHIVVDGSTHLSETLMRAIDMADQILLVTDLAPGSVQGAGICEAILTRCDVPAERIGLVLNRVDDQSPVDVSAALGSIASSVVAVLPRRDAQARAATAATAPINFIDPQSDLSAEYSRLARAIAEGTPLRSPQVAIREQEHASAP
ncbi:MAG TPA: AAA family ATPase [Candidatus Dormibacteraeota bacterium]|nr:AAA family ATPase [Candidatus Dormibacteraeota bacterium]